MPLINSLINDVTDFGKGTLKSFKDTIKGKKSRNDNQKIEDDYYNKTEVSIANKHVDAISSILDDTFSGNIFEAGATAIKLYQTGTKWTILRRQEVDRNKFTFKYLNDNIYTDIDTPNAESSQLTVIGDNYFDAIEDPTILGFNLRIDFKHSPLFKNLENPINAASSQLTVRAGAADFITQYSTQHPELRNCNQLLKEFTEIAQKIFSAPEVETDFLNKKYKNHYLYSIKNLEKLDNNRFVSNKETHDTLNLVLGEDIRMYVNRMAIIYKNLTWSYHSGKKLIPENLLRFNMFIKVSEMRNYTLNNKENSIDYEESDKKYGTITDVIRNHYSRVVYEIKDCEFMFNESIIPADLKIGGMENNEQYADLTITIKYRKVNRIFYSRMFNNNYDYYILGDKFYNNILNHTNTSNLNEYTKELPLIDDDILRDKKTIYREFKSQFEPEIIAQNDTSHPTHKQRSTSNNIHVEQSLATQFGLLKNNGIFNEQEDDNALNRFVKTVGNTAVKAGATIVDDNIQKIKTNIKNNATSFMDNVFDNNIGRGIKALLKGNITFNTLDLGKVYDIDDTKTDIKKPIKDNPDLSSQYLNSLKQNLSFTDSTIRYLNEDKGNGKQVVFTDATKEDLMPDLNEAIIEPKDDNLSSGQVPIIIAPKEDLMPDLNEAIIAPKEDLMPNINQAIISPKEDLMPNINQAIIAPNDDRMPDLNEAVIEPKEDLMPNLNQAIIAPNDDRMPDLNQAIIAPKEDLMHSLNNGITAPKSNLHNKFLPI